LLSAPVVQIDRAKDFGYESGIFNNLKNFIENRIDAVRALIWAPLFIAEDSVLYYTLWHNPDTFDIKVIYYSDISITNRGDIAD
jgi:hypothetical protein